jgi:hypothetical protein
MGYRINGEQLNYIGREPTQKLFGKLMIGQENKPKEETPEERRAKTLSDPATIGALGIALLIVGGFIGGAIYDAHKEKYK